MIDKQQPLSVSRRCQLLNGTRSSLYYQPAPVPAEDQVVMRALDEVHQLGSFLGSQLLVDEPTKPGLVVNRERAPRLMRVVGISR